jgi:hypothetical protein
MNDVTNRRGDGQFAVKTQVRLGDIIKYNL